VQPGLFRQQALDKLSSPDQLDQTMRVADPKRWIALAAIGVLLLGALVWAFVGRIDSRTQAACVLVPRGGTYKIVTTTAGTVYDVLVERGDQLDAGEPVAVIETVTGRRRNVVAPFSGGVVELLATFGDFVNVGDDILNFESDEEELGVLLYVPPAVSGQLSPGMQARISPATAGRQQFGFLLGQLDQVAPYPSTRDGMVALLNNDTLADQLYRNAAGTPVEVWVQPERADTPTGFRWSSSQGPERLRAGTLCTVDVVLAQRRPIDLLLP
jgi:multidrug efflux pump subunit AcrA (membrane-fusion protein)